MTTEQKRELINRVADTLLDDSGKVTSDYKKTYGTTTVGASKVKKAYTEIDYIGIPNIEKNIVDVDSKTGDKKIKSKFLKSEYMTTEVNGKKVQSKEKVETPNTEAMSVVTNKAQALTTAYAMLLEFEKVYEDLDKKQKQISDLEAKIKSLETEIKNLKR